MKLESKWKIGTIWQRVKSNRKYKDRLFRRVFSDKKDLLDLYNAVNHTNYTNPDELEITTLEDSIYLSMKNDLSFIISSTLNLYEHQSTYNPNMPIRGFLYFARLYESHIAQTGKNLYSSRLVKLPTPQFIVFYNGRKELPDVVESKLSDAFELQPEGEAPTLECRAKLLNINYGHNKELLQTCKRLHDYAYFVAEVNGNLDNGYSLKAAINMAIRKCIEENVLADILIKSESEVRNMLLTEFNMRKYRKMMLKEGLEDGRKEGREIGREEGREIGLEEGRKIGREIGREEGHDEILALTAKLLEQNRSEDVLRAASDKSYREQLFKEFNL